MENSAQVPFSHLHITGENNQAQASCPNFGTVLACASDSVQKDFSGRCIRYDMQNLNPEDRIPFVVRGLIQLVICAGVLLVGYFISGGIPVGTGFGVGVIYFLVEMGFGLLIWIGNFIYFWHEARLIKKNLAERNKAEGEGLKVKSD